MTGILRVVTLVEHEPTMLVKDDISQEEAATLTSAYGGMLELDYPTPRTGNCWRLRSNGWVGLFPVSSNLRISVVPKTPLRNVFGMWEYAFRLKGIRLFDDIFRSESLEAFYSQLAGVLAKKIIERERRGLAREYVSASDRLPFLTGKLDVASHIRQPLGPLLPSEYDNHTADVDNNRLLGWTLSAILTSQLCSPIVTPIVRHAYKAVCRVASVEPFEPSDCIGRSYTRLTQDYEPMHLLCYFFLEHSVPSHQSGNRYMLPFVVNMASLFELFVAEWLKAHSPPGLVVRSHESVKASGRGSVAYDIDLVLNDTTTNKAVFILDTKYKADFDPSQNDLNQVLAYATLKSCQEAVLVYPSDSIREHDLTYADINVRTRSFDLGGDLDAAGFRFLVGLGVRKGH